MDQSSATGEYSKPQGIIVEPHAIVTCFCEACCRHKTNIAVSNDANLHKDGSSGSPIVFVRRLLARVPQYLCCSTEPQYPVKRKRWTTKVIDQRFWTKVISSENASPNIPSQKSRSVMYS